MDINETSLQQTKDIIKDNIKSNFEIIEEKMQFSRGPALQSGLEGRNGNDLIFFCDVGNILKDF